MSRRSFAVGTVALATAGLTGCSQNTHDAVAPQPLQTIAPCPLTSVAPHVWPSPAPQDLPWPATGVQGETKQQNGLTYIRFSSSQSLREELVPLLRALRKAGYVIGRGDAETQEADVPFAKDNLRGLYKLVRSDRCQTQWIVALGNAGGGGRPPVVPSYSPRPSATPLTFG